MPCRISSSQSNGTPSQSNGGGGGGWEIRMETDDDTVRSKQDRRKRGKAHSPVCWQFSFNFSRLPTHNTTLARELGLRSEKLWVSEWVLSLSVSPILFNQTQHSTLWPITARCVKWKQNVRKRKTVFSIQSLITHKHTRRHSLRNEPELVWRWMEAPVFAEFKRCSRLMENLRTLRRNFSLESSYSFTMCNP